MSGNNTNNTDAEFKNVTDTSFGKISSTLTKIGYAEGVSAGKEAGIQTGFDLGYARSLETSLQIAAIKSFLQTASDCDNAEVVCEVLKFKNIFSSTFHESISVDNLKAETVILNQILDKLKQEFPQIHSLIIIK